MKNIIFTYEIGDVLKRVDEFRVVTEIINGKVEKTEQLEMYIAKNIIVTEHFNGWRISDLIMYKCGDYIENHRLIELPI